MVHPTFYALLLCLNFSINFGLSIKIIIYIYIKKTAICLNGHALHLTPKKQNYKQFFIDKLLLILT